MEVLATGTIHCGHYLILFGGEVEAVERSFAGRSTRRAAPSSTRCSSRTPRRASCPRSGPGSMRWPAPGDTLGVLQAGHSNASARRRAALKGAQVELVELRLGDGLGGKAIASLWGETHDVEAAIEIARASLEKSLAAGASTAVIPRADPAVLEASARGAVSSRSSADEAR